MVTVTKHIGSITMILLFLSFASAQPSDNWQNPKIGFSADLAIPFSDESGEWQSDGLVLRGGELLISSNIDPYAELMANILLTEHGTEVHELYSLFPLLPLNLKAKGGIMLANFGRWNRFHLHAMPFSSEPRIYHEYAGGVLALKGVELSWLAPISHYLEVTFSCYDGMKGHTHDNDPFVSHKKELSAAEIAQEIGAEAHGSHWDFDGKHLFDDELTELYSDMQSNKPTLYSGKKGFDAFTYGGRVTTAFEFGPDFCLDVGGSALYNQKYKFSKGVDSTFYKKLLWGSDLTLFWHPLSANKYRNGQIGLEFLQSYEGFERVDGVTYKDYYYRSGIFGYTTYRHNEEWSVGAFSSLFESNDAAKELNKHYGTFITYGITHYQYLRFEVSRYDYHDQPHPVNKMMLQYNAVIGFHSHGSQR